MSNPVKEANIKLIGKIKKDLKDISVTELCQRLNYSRQNLHQHLTKKNLASSEKSDYLIAIASTIVILKSDNEKSAKQKASTINKTLLTA